MTLKTWLLIVLPTGLALGLMIGMAADAQTVLMSHAEGIATTMTTDSLPEVWDVTKDQGEWTSTDAQTGQPTPWPHFKQHPQGWVPSCPSGQTLIRHDPPPDCVWGTRPMNQKPTQGDMECVAPAQASKLPACKE
jgi:hypothetical protein